MGGLARMDRRRLDQFNRYWERLYYVFPQARAEAVKAMGEAAQQELGRQIQSADLGEQAKEHVLSWQEMRMGSKGGYAALSPKRGTAQTWVQRKYGGTVIKQQTNKGAAVTKAQVTRWLERGHGVGYRAGPVKGSRWEMRARINDRTGKHYVAGRYFYSFTKLRALELGLKAADRVLNRITDEIDF